MRNVPEAVGKFAVKSATEDDTTREEGESPGGRLADVGLEL